MEQVRRAARRTSGACVRSSAQQMRSRARVRSGESTGSGASTGRREDNEWVNANKQKRGNKWMPLPGECRDGYNWVWRILPVGEEMGETNGCRCPAGDSVLLRRRARAGGLATNPRPGPNGAAVRKERGCGWGRGWKEEQPVHPYYNPYVSSSAAAAAAMSSR